MLSHWLDSLDTNLGRRSRQTILFLALLSAIAVGVADYFLKPDLLVLYLVSLYVAAWYGGIRPGVMVAIYAAGSGFVTQVLTTGSTDVDTTAVITLVIRVLAFLLIVAVVARLRESRRQQEELSSFIVHDLRSPISSAITGLQTLDQIGDNLDGTEREMVQLALVSNQRALTLVNSILDVSKMESGKMEVHRTQVATDPFLQEVIEPLRLWARGHAVHILAEPLVGMVLIDHSLTSRVLTNLLSNALKFSKPGSQVTLRAESDGPGVKFSVIDQGPGIPADAIEEIFEPFGQVTGTKGGTGLGLTFCRLAVRAQGGKIGVSSTLGQGSTFWFTLPG
jgi:signal transduction histidine kinase